MKKNLLKLFLFIFLVSTMISPVVVLAQPAPLATPVDACASLSGIGKIICKINQILKAIIPALIALGLIYFIWGVVRYVIGGEEETKKKGREAMIYGIIGLAVIVGVWGLVNVITNTFGLGGGVVPPLATAPAGTCTLPPNPKLPQVLDYITCTLYKSVVPLIFALSLVMFIWGVVQFVINSGEEAKKEKGRQFMIWGIIALTVMACVWGLVALLGGTFGIDANFIPKVKP